MMIQGVLIFRIGSWGLLIVDVQRDHKGILSVIIPTLALGFSGCRAYLCMPHSTARVASVNPEPFT